MFLTANECMPCIHLATFRHDRLLINSLYVAGLSPLYHAIGLGFPKHRQFTLKPNLVERKPAYMAEVLWSRERKNHL